MSNNSGQFARTALLLGQNGVETLQRRRVAVFGVSGVGGHCAEALCRTGVGALDIFDGDVVDITNINRQIIATHTTLGAAKADAMRERLLDINPDAIITAYKLFYLPETADAVDLSIYDYIVDAVDTMAAKLELACRASVLGVPIISSMGAANKLDPTALEVADIYQTSVCPMARIMRRELRKRGVLSLKAVYSKEPPIAPMYPESAQSPATRKDDRPVRASAAFVPPVAGLIMASEVVKDLLNTSMKRSFS